MNTTAESAVPQLSEVEAVVLEIGRKPEYRSATGQIAWEKAMAEHPEWKPILCYPSRPDHPQAGYNTIAKLRSKGLWPHDGKAKKIASAKLKGSGRNSAAAKRGWEKRRKLQAQEGGDEKTNGSIPVAVLAVCKFCPACGHTLETLFKAALFDDKRQRQAMASLTDEH